MTNQFRYLMLSCMFVFLGIEQASAQPVEVFGGYTLGRMKSDDGMNRASLNGWSTSITGYPVWRLGLTADIAGFYGSVNPTVVSSDGTTTTLPHTSVRQYSFLGGPQFRVIRKRHFESSIRALAGGAYGEVPTSAYGFRSQTTFAALIGSNFDVNVSRRVAMRFSPGLYLTQFGPNQTQKNFRFSVGPVFRLGGGE